MIQKELTNNMLSYKIYYAAQDIKEDINNIESSNSFLLNYNYFKAIEDANITGLTPMYALVYMMQDVVGLIYFQAINLAAKDLGKIIQIEPYGKLLNLISDSLTKSLFCKDINKANWLLVCGNMNVSGQFAFASNIGFEKELVAIIPSVILHISDGLKKEGKLSAVVVKDFLYDDENIEPVLSKKSFNKFVMDPIMTMDNIQHWNCFDDYLNAQSAKYRLRTKNVIKKINTLQEVNLNLADIEKNIACIDELYQAVLKRSPIQILKPSANVFIQYKKYLGDNFLFKAFYLEGKMIAFMTGIFNKYQYEAHHIGLDYKYNNSHALYQNILYKFIDEAIRTKVQTLSFGRTALEIKTTVGAKPIEHAAYIRLNNGLLNKLIKPFLPSSSPLNWVARNPFK